MNSFRFIERGIRAEIARQEKLLAGRRSGSRRRRSTSTRAPARSPRCAPRRRRTTTATSPSPTSCRSRSSRRCSTTARGGDERAARRACGALGARRSGLSARERPAAGLPRRAGRLLRGRARRRRRAGPRPRRRSRTGSPAISSRACEAGDGAGGRAGARTGAGEDPAIRACEPAAMAALVGLACGEADQRRRRRARCSTGWSPRAAIRGDRRGRGARGDRRRGGPGARSSRPRSRPTRMPPSACGAGNAKAIGPIVGYVMRETKGRADGGEVTKLVQRAARDLTSARAGIRNRPRASRRRCSPGHPMPAWASRSMPADHILDGRPMAGVQPSRQYGRCMS